MDVIKAFAALFALRYRWWWLMAIAAFLVLPVALVSQTPYLPFWLFGFVSLAAAVALRWRVRIAGWFWLVLAAVAVWGAVLIAYSLVPRGAPLYWILFIAPLLGFLALGWDRPPWWPAG